MSAHTLGARASRPQEREVQQRVRKTVRVELASGEGGRDARGPSETARPPRVNTLKEHSLQS